MSIDATAVARVTGITTQFLDLRGASVRYLPQRIALVGQGSTAATFATTKAQVTSAAEVGAAYGYGSQLHLAARELMPVNGDGVGSIPVTVYPLDDHASGVAAAGDITPSGTATADGTYYIRIGGILSGAFSIPAGAIAGQLATVLDAMAAACASILHFPFTAANNADTDLALTCKWKGTTGNGILVEVIGPSVGVTFTITQPVNGATNPDVDPALNQVGNVWETLVLNCGDIADTTTLNKYQTWGEGRWGTLVRKPAVVFTGNTDATLSSATAVSDARPTDRINSQLVGVGSPNLPCVVAARQLVRIAKLAQNNPPTDYGSQQATGLIPGTDGEQWTWVQRDAAVKAGSSTIEVKDGVINISDVVTFYKPTGEDPPAYRYVVDIVKLQNIIYNLDLEFASPNWDGMILIPNDQATTNPNARKPKDVVAAIAGILDALGLDAFISDPKTAKKNTSAVINAQNPKRCDASTKVQLSGNVNIIDVTLNFGFYFGGAAAA